MGAVIRDDSGSFVGGYCKRLSNVFSAELAEAIALREGLQVAKRMACHNLIVQSDCDAVVDAFNSNGSLSSVIGPIIGECRTLAQDFGSVVVQSCNRESNQVAHELAKFGRDNPPTLWCDVPPDILLPLLVNDVTMDCG